MFNHKIEYDLFITYGEKMTQTEDRKIFHAAKQKTLKAFKKFCGSVHYCVYYSHDEKYIISNLLPYLNDNADYIKINKSLHSLLTPSLRVAILKNFYGVTKMLLNHIDVNTEMETGISALHYAADTDLKMIKLLIQYGANINPKNSSGQTPLDYAKTPCGYIEYYYAPPQLNRVENFLIAKGAYGKVKFFLL